MAELTVGTRTTTFKSVQRFPGGQPCGSFPYSCAAKEALTPGGKRDNQLVDGLILTDGKDDVVVKQRGFNKVLREGTRVQLDGKPMTVLRSINVPDTWGEKWAHWTKAVPLAFQAAFDHVRGRGAALR